jgi:hypothetical protein
MKVFINFDFQLLVLCSSDRQLRLWVRIPPGTWMFVCCECCVSLGRGLCDELITRPEESYRLCRVVVCDIETSWPTGGCCAKKKEKKFFALESVLDDAFLVMTLLYFLQKLFL